MPRRSLASPASSPPANPPLASPAAPGRPEHGHAHDHRQRARALLSEHRLRVTEPRLRVLTALLDQHRPMTAQELIDGLADACLDHVTIYRTLNTLCEQGIAQAVGTTERGRRFEVHACEGCRVDHPHVECRGCGAIECMEQELSPALVVPKELFGYEILEARLHLYGRCPRCRTA